MTLKRSYEDEILAPALGLLQSLGSTRDSQLEILEGAASLLGGFSLNEFRSRFDCGGTLKATRALQGAEKVLGVVAKCPIPAPLALCALARPHVSEAEQRSSGAYYTDYRLAQFLANAVESRLVSGSRVIDPAAGTGILLVAASLAACGDDRRRRTSWLAESVTAWDISQDALRGARLALASLTADLRAVEKMVSRWLCHDSLLAKGVPEAAFDVVIGNPPWEKLKITRHEFLRANGSPRHYGADYPTIDQGLFSEKHDCMAKYGAELLLRYPMLGSGEPDLYRAFIELFLKLARPEGCVSVLVPAGLIRSEGTQDLRAFLFDNAGDLSFTVLENRARFFAIDTRFKFLGLLFTKTDVERRRRTIRIAHSRGTEHGVERIGSALLDRKTLQATRPDLTVPEVKSQEEWRLFNTMYANGESSILPGSIWQNEIVREVDMTRDAKNFQRDRKAGLLPLIEGRMVHQHRFGAKTYKSGTGRQAKWEIVPLGTKKIEPQFWYPQNALPPAVRQRVDSLRAGFCDITGQTNERTMLAALVPPGVVCGNKVPTVRFINDTREERLYLWLAVVNSFSFDWALRRIVTTTVNYFLLNSMPLPKLSLDSAVGRTVVAASRELSLIDSAVNAIDIWKVAHLRASIDVGVHAAYGLDFKDLELMFQDFPLLDRAQPPLRGEQRSTVTRDFVLSHASEYFNLQHNAFADRLSAASAVGAVPYVPSEFAAAGIELPVEASHG